MKADLSQRIVINIIKWALFAVVTGLLIFMLVKPGESASAAAFSDVKAAVTEAADTENMSEGDARMLRRLYDIDPEDLEDVTFYYPASNIGADELLVLRVKEDAQKANVMAAIEARNAAQLKAFEGYGVMQTKALESALIREHGRDVIYVVGDDAEAVVSAWESAL